MRNISDFQTQLREHLKNEEDWEKITTLVLDVNVVKLPSTKPRPALLCLEVDLLNIDEKPSEKKKLFIKNKEMLV